jgi:hypothetical protein
MRLARPLRIRADQSQHSLCEAANRNPDTGTIFGEIERAAPLLERTSDRCWPPVLRTHGATDSAR